MKTKIMMIIIILIMSLTCLQVQAVDTETQENKVEITANKIGLKPGEEVILTVNLVNVKTSGINDIMTTLDYDTRVFEELTTENITCLNTWSNLEYDSTTGLIKVHSNQLQTAGEVINIKLKVNSSITFNENEIKETEISLTGMSMSNGEIIPNATKTLKIAQTINEVELITDKSNVQIGDTLTATVSIKNFLDNDGIDKTNIKINFDSKIFKQEYIEYLNGWTNNSSTSGETLYLQNNAKVTSGDILKITFTVKESINFRENEIKNTQITILADEQEISANINVAQELNEVHLTADKTELQKGETVTFTIDLRNFIEEFEYNKQMQKGIDTLRGVIEYDKTIFEELTTRNFSGRNNWRVDFDKDTNIWEIKNTLFKTEGEVLKITLTVKENAKIGTTKVSLKTIVATNKENEYNPGDKTVNINIVGETLPTISGYVVTDGEYLTKIGTNTTVDELKSHIETNAKIRVYNQSDREITGKELVGTGMTITIGEKIEYKLIVTGDLSGDGQLTMQDISLMQLHIVKLKTLEGIYEKSADMNGDGSIRVSDLSMICILRVGL